MMKNSVENHFNRNVQGNSAIFYLLVLIIGFSLYTTLLLFFDNGWQSDYGLLWLLPFTFVIVCMIVVNNYQLLVGRVSSLLIFGLYFVRMVITPFFMFFGDYAVYGYNNYLNSYSREAIVLMCYEAIIVFTFLIFMIQKLKKDNEPVIQEPREQKTSRKIKLPILFKLVVFGLLSYVVLLIIINPSLLRSNFLFLIGTPDDWKIQQQYASLDGGGSGPLGILVTFLNTAFWLLQAFIPPILLLKIIQAKFSYTKKLVLSLLLLGTVMLISTETRAHSIECAAALLIVMGTIYGKKFTKKIPLLIFIFIYVMIVGLFSKSGVGMNFEELSRTLSAYFSGPQNVATAIGVAKEYDYLNISMIPADIFLKVPYLSSFFNTMFTFTSNDIFNIAFVDIYGRSIGQIIPAIGQGYVYFGYIFAPLVPCFAVWLAVKFEKHARSSANIVLKYNFYLAAIMMSRATVISNMLSGVNYLFHIFLSLFIVYVSVKFIIRKQRKLIKQL